METKNPILGGLLNMLIPGLGYVYVRRWWIALAYFIFAPILLIVLLTASGVVNNSQPPWPAYVCPSLAVLIYLVSMFSDGMRAVKQHNQKLERVRCPFCKEVIQAGAIVCRYCQRDLTQLPAGTSLEPAPPPGMSTGRRVAISALVAVAVLVGICAVVAVLFVATQPDRLPDQVRELIPGLPATQSGGGWQPAGPTQEEPAAAPSFEEATLVPEPSPTPGPALNQADLLDFSSGIACLGTPGDGLTCLDSGGWHTITEVLGPHNIEIGEVSDLAFCPDGQLWIAQAGGLLATDGAQWRDYSAMPDFSNPELVTCDPDGGVWLGKYGSVTRLQDDQITTYESSNFGTGEYVDQVKDLAVAPDGRLWVATASSVAVFDGQDWETYELNKGWDEQYSVEQLAIGSDGVVWAGTSSHGLLRFDGESWTADDRDFLSSIQAMTLVPEDQVWVGTYSQGLSRYNGGWQNFKTINTFLSSDHIQSLASDQAGRLWIGTEWGLNIKDGADWTSYHMSNTDLPHEEIEVLAVGGAGPALPEPETKPNGALQGRFTFHGDPLANARVEVCVEMMGNMYSGATPCSKQPFVAKATTDAQGAFLIEDLPAGYYVVTVQAPDGGWKQLTSGIGLVSRKTRVEPGSTTTLEEMDIGS